MKEKIIGTWKLASIEFLNFDDLLKMFSEMLGVPPEATEQIGKDLKQAFEKDVGKDYLNFALDGSVDYLTDNKKGTWKLNEQENSLEMTKQGEEQALMAEIKELTDDKLAMYVEINQNGAELKINWHLEKA